MAAASGYHDVVKVLLYHKCTVDAQDRDGITPLYLATYHGNYEVMKMLVGAFANVNAVTKVISFELCSLPPLLVPRSSHNSLLDHLQCAKMEGEGLVHFITWMMSVST